MIALPSSITRIAVVKLAVHANAALGRAACRACMGVTVATLAPAVCFTFAGVSRIRAALAARRHFVTTADAILVFLESQTYGSRNARHHLILAFDVHRAPFEFLAEKPVSL